LRSVLSFVILTPERTGGAGIPRRSENNPPTEEDAMTETRDRFTQMLCTAQEMEEKGRAFYEKALATCENPLGKEIFRLLIDDEKVHLERIRQISDSLTKVQGWSEDWKKLQCPYQDLGKVFRDLAARQNKAELANSSDLEALKLAQDFELRSVELYENQLPRATDPLEKAFLVQMIVEEKAHYRALQDTTYYLSDPEGWFMEKERAGLEGAG
jgi:rubrerythrin